MSCIARLSKNGPSRSQGEKFISMSRLLAALADENQLVIVRGLVAGARTVRELCEFTGQTQLVVMRYLRSMKYDGVIMSWADIGGTQHRLAHPAMKDLADIITTFNDPPDKTRLT